MAELALNCTISLSSLLCGEDETCLDEDDGFSLNDSSLSDTEEEYISLLVERECSFNDSQDCSDDCLLIENWKKCARLQAIKWILKMTALFSFGFQTAYLSVTYLDRFLSRRAIDKGQVWAIQLLAVACLSLAAKMEECKVPLLYEFQDEDYDFGPVVIQRMELLVLNTLEWRMKSVTPFSYLNYFINKFSNNSRPKALLSRTTDLILGTLEVINFMDHRPSVIAAAAVLIASGQSLTKKSMEFKIGSIISRGSIENEHLFSCYNLMQDLETGKWKIPKIVISPDLPSIYTSSVDSIDDGSFNSNGPKRRKLNSNDFTNDSKETQLSINHYRF